MIVYAETNFLLELAYAQEEHEACTALLAEAARGALDLRIPAFAVAEARVTRRRRAADRTRLQQLVQNELRELTRSSDWVGLRDQSAALVAALVDSGEAARQRLENAIARLTASGRILPLDSETIGGALEAEDRLDMSTPDALVYAAVARDAQATDEQGPARIPKCFLSRDKKAFDNPDLRRALNTYDCQVLTSFKAGLAYVHAGGRALG